MVHNNDAVRFDVVLLRAGDETEALVKAIRWHTQLGLPEVARLMAQAGMRSAVSWAF